MNESANLVYTIGHSTRTTNGLLLLLGEHTIGVVVDVRRYPASRRHPQFERDALAASLAGAGIAYVHEPALGGRRTPVQDSPNTGLTSASFRGYADHTATASFRAALDRLVATASQSSTVIMCAEAVPWRCHRQLIADQLVARGIAVCHILGSGRSERHRLSPTIRRTPDGNLIYPGTPGPQFRFFDAEQG